MISTRIRNIKIHGIILKTRVFKEHGKSVTVFSRQLGKIDVIAPGGRKLTSPLIGKLELFNYCNFELYKSTKQSLTITHCEIINSFPSIKSDLDRIQTAAHIIYLIYHKFQEEPAPECFEICLEALEALEKNIEKNLLFEMFRVKLYEKMGLLPSFSECSKCHRPLRMQDFSKKQNIFHPYCHDCYESTSQSQYIDIKALKLLKFLNEKPFLNLRKLRLKTPEKKLLHRFTDQLFTHHPWDFTSSRITRITPFTFSS